MSLAGCHTVLVLGGIRSGKSEYAESLLEEVADVRYIATAEDSGADDPEWAARIAAHRERRPAGWYTEETGTDPGRLVALLAEAKPADTILVDDLGGWLTAVLRETGWTPSGPRGPVAALVDAVRDCAAQLVVVSPEVGLGVLPETSAGRLFADCSGAANRALAEVMDGVVLVLAGQQTWLKRPAPVVAAPATVTAPPVTVPVVAPVRMTGVPAEPTLVLDDPAGQQQDGTTITAGMTLPLPDEASSVAAADRLRLLDVPGRGLGELDRLVSFAAGVQQTATPQPFRQVRALLVYGSHEGGAASGDERLDLPRRVAQVRAGEAPLNLMAAAARAGVQVVDTTTAEGLGTAAPIEDTDAMPLASVDGALRYGARLVDAAVDSGTDLFVLAATGPGQQAAAAALVAATTNAEPAALLDRVVIPGGAIDDEAWMARCGAVRDALRRIRGGDRGPHALLTALGGPDLAVATGILLAASVRRTPVLLDGPVGVAAALVARELAGPVRLWTVVLDLGRHPTVRKAADSLSLEPLVDLGMGLGEGANALALLPLLQAALALSTVDAVPEAQPSDTAPSEDVAPSEDTAPSEEADTVPLADAAPLVDTAPEADTVPGAEQAEPSTE